MFRRCSSFAIAIFLGALVSAPTLAQAKKMLDHSSYDEWNSISFVKLSPDGKWILYTIRPTSNPKGKTTLHIRNTESNKLISVPRAVSARFTDDSQHVLYVIPAEKKTVKKSEKKKPDPKEKKPKSTSIPSKLVIHHLASRKTKTISKAGGYTLPGENPNWIAYTIGATVSASNMEMLKKIAEKYKKAGKPLPSKLKALLDKGKTTKSTVLHLRSLKNGKDWKFAEATSYRFSKNGRLLAFIRKGKDEAKSGVYLVELKSAAIGKIKPIAAGKGKYQSLAFDETGKQLAFLTTRDDAKSKTPAWSVYCWRAGKKDAKPVATGKSAGLPKNWQIASSRSPSFSRNGKRLFFGTQPKPKPAPKTKSKVAVEIWHWRDPLLQPMQKVQARLKRSQTFSAVLQIGADKIVQLATENTPAVALSANGNGHFAFGSNSKPYHPLISWDYPRYSDYAVIDVRTGKEKHRLTKIQGSVSFSPTGKYLTWWDTKKLAWMAMHAAGGKTTCLSAKVPHAVHNELHDQPAPASPYGTAGWVKGDKAILIYDKHDIWAIEPEGSLQPICVTDGLGRKQNLRFRSLTLNRKDGAIDPSKPLLLTAFDLKNKASGFYRDQVGSVVTPQKLFMAAESHGSVQRSKDGDKIVFSQSTFQRYPDLWVTNREFKSSKRITNANPQQSKFLWGSAELVHWTSLDGNRLDGIVYKPDGFNAKKKYPLLVYFYERSSHNLHRYFTPAPASSSINVSFYVSRGYVVFVPDIPYRVGHPGQSCLNAVLPGVTSLVNRGFIDKRKIGVQGHSWGGYQIAYLVTKTKMFAAAEAGAPVSNMTSAYGGIRWSSGMSRMFQYEKTQSRIGGTLWDAQHRYIENSPVFWADRVETPLLMMHNDRDGAVPWYQGIEMFVAMRRLGKPCWMVNYNGEQHGLTKTAARRDWSIRLQQFFDHYLKGAPPPRWLSEGVPYAERTTTTGLELKK